MNHLYKRCFDLTSEVYELLKHRLSVEDRETVRAYIYDYNEWGLGLETILDILDEDAISISLTEKNAVLNTMDAMGIDRSQYKLRLSE